MMAFFLYISNMSEIIRSYEVQEAKIMNEINDLVLQINKLTDEGLIKPYLKKIDILEVEYNNITAKIEESLYVEYLIENTETYSVNEDLGRVLGIREAISLLDDGEISMDADIFYVNDKRNDIFHGHAVSASNLINRKYCKDFDCVFVFNSDVELTTLNNSFIPFDEWDEEF